MKLSTNDQIRNLAKDLELINIIFWLTIILALVSSVGFMIYVSRKISQIGQIMILVGCGTLILSILNIYLIWSFIIRIENIDTISSLLFNNIIIIKYIHIPLILGFFSLLTSTYYTLTIVSFSIDYFKSSKKTKKESKQKTIEAQISDKKAEIATKKWIEEKREIPEKISTIENDFFPKKPSFDEILSKPNKGGLFVSEEIEKSDEQINTENKFFNEKQTEPLIEKKEEPIRNEILSEDFQKQTEERAKPSSQSPIFEQAISSAIEKRQPEIEKNFVEDKNQQFEDTKVLIQCPDCKNIYIIQKGKNISEIECPKCGKKGSAK
jgi:ribosomal protein S27E